MQHMAIPISAFLASEDGIGTWISTFSFMAVERQELWSFPETQNAGALLSTNEAAKSASGWLIQTRAPEKLPLAKEYLYGSDGGGIAVREDESGIPEEEEMR